jgi:hypothetical protein
MSVLKDFFVLNIQSIGKVVNNVNDVYIISNWNRQKNKLLINRTIGNYERHSFLIRILFLKEINPAIICFLYKREKMTNYKLRKKVVQSLTMSEERKWNDELSYFHTWTSDLIEKYLPFIRNLRSKE